MSDIPWNQSTEFSAQFRTTAWSEVHQAARSGDATTALEAWEFLCRAYWKPVFAHIRRLGNAHEDAKDLTQGFFYHLLCRERLKNVDPTHGKFRSFLLASLNHFLHSEWDKRIAKKRDQRIVISLDMTDEEGNKIFDPADGMSPDKCFARDWAQNLFARVRGRLAVEMESPGKESLLDLLPSVFYEPDSVPYKTLAQKLSLSEDNVKKRVQRLRERWGDLLKEEVLATVQDASAVDEEIRYLLSINE